MLCLDIAVILATTIVTVKLVRAIRTGDRTLSHQRTRRHVNNDKTGKFPR